MKQQIIDLLLPYSDRLVLILITFFAPLLPAMVAVGLLIIIDTITGVIAARRNKETVTSKKMGGILTKMLVYQLLIISAHLCEAFLFPIIPFVKITIAFLAVVEFKSISENFQKSTGLPFLKFIKSYLDDKLRGLIKDDREKPQDPTS